jgi:hypothetical protein
MSYCAIKIGSWFIPEAKTVVHQWGKNAQVSNEKAKDVLKINFIDYKTSVVEMGYDLIDKGYVPDKRKK